MTDPTAQGERDGGVPPDRIFLLGLMGAGKTTIGNALAQRLGWPHVDNDDALVAESGLTRAELSAIDVPDLHALESAHARILCSEPPPLIAGIAASVADDPDTVSLLAGRGFCVYLALSLDSALARVGTSGVGRQTMAADTVDALHAVFERRDPAYRTAAALTVDATRDPDDICDEIVAALRKCGGGSAS